MLKGLIKPYYFLIATCIVLPSHAQMTDVLYESFSSPSKYWWSGKDETKDVQFTSGKYKVNLISTKGGRLFHISINPDFTKDFILEATFRQISGDDNDGIGFLWGYDPSSGHNNSFCFTSTGFVRSWTSDDLRKSEREWQKTTFVKPMRVDNKLRVEKNGNNFKYILNGEVEIIRKELPKYVDKILMVF
jgi:hypothetical protein